MHARSPLFNSILPSKIYGIWHGHKKLDEIPADSPKEALELARGKWGNSIAAILQPGKTSATRTEPMFP